MKILLLGNCQMVSYGVLLKAANLGDTTVLRYNEVSQKHMRRAWLDRFDLILTPPQTRDRAELWKALEHHPDILFVPVLIFDGFTPDDESRVFLSPGRGSVTLSKIAVGAYRNGLSRQEAQELYAPEFCDLMGYPAALDRARRNLVARLAPIMPQAAYFYAKWYARGPFFYTLNHPRLFVVEDVLREVLRDRKDLPLPPNLSEFCPDPLQEYGISPQLNHPAATNLLTDPAHRRRKQGRAITCGDFVDYCYTQLEENEQTVTYNEQSNEIFDAALKKWRTVVAPGAVSNPYRAQPAWAFWSRAVARPEMGKVRPVGQTAPVIGPRTRVATAGSCFAQHVARAMVADGLNYHVAEKAPAGMDPKLADERGYGLFSARYGNIYSSRQLSQLIRRAYGDFTPVETAWPVEGGFVDPLRPNIGELFESPEAVETARAEHLGHVRRMFEELDVFVFTMGLTESWIDRRDGTAFPVAPAAVSSGIDPRHFTFINAGYEANHREMNEFLSGLCQVNPKARVILTVSPVPLIATYTDTDALSATTYSKSVLRAVAGDLATQFDHVSYFPSFEIITGSYSRGSYFAEDLRSVKPEGVEHVMGIFRELLVTGNETQPDLAQETHVVDEDYQKEADVVCDEEMLLR